MRFFTTTLIAPLFALSSAALAVELDVYCLKKQCEAAGVKKAASSIRGAGGTVNVHILDYARQFESVMSAEMKKRKPLNQKEGERIAIAMQSTPIWQQSLKQFKASVDALNDVVEMKLDKLPAFVCEGSSVVYGGTLAQAHKVCAGYVRSSK